MNINELLPDEIIVIHHALERDALPHAFGGAISLAFCGIPRYTQDIDINIALKVDQHGPVLNALASLFPIADRARVEREILQNAQVRLRWGATPVDLFFSDIPFHESIAARAREVDYVGTRIRVISAEDLIICKAAYDRGKDWLDIENIFKVRGQYLDQGYLTRWLGEFFESEDERVRRIEGYMSAFGSRPGPEGL